MSQDTALYEKNATVDAEGKESMKYNLIHLRYIVKL